MKIKIENHENSATRVIDYPGTVLQFMKIHYLAWGFYQVIRTGTDAYAVYDKFSGAHVDTISKAKKGDILS